MPIYWPVWLPVSNTQGSQTFDFINPFFKYTRISSGSNGGAKLKREGANPFFCSRRSMETQPELKLTSWESFLRQLITAILIQTYHLILSIHGNNDTVKVVVLIYNRTEKGHWNAIHRKAKIVNRPPTSIGRYIPISM